MAEKKKRGYLADAWLVLCLAAGFGVALSGVHLSLSGKIKENKLNEIYGKIPELVAGAKSGEEFDIGDKRVYRAMDESGKQVGWVVPAEGDGYADRIELLIGLDLTASEVTGLYVLAQKETPALGDKIRSEEFEGQFAGKRADQAITYTKGVPAGNEIQAISGATISSKSVCKIVNKTMTDLREKLIAEAKTE